MGGRWMHELSWRAASAAVAEGAIVLLPIGAAAKAHGPHLPLGTDRIVVEAVAERVAEPLGALIAPTVGFGYFPAFVEYPTSQHIDAAAFHDLLAQLLIRLAQDGARRLVVLNNGVSTEAVVSTAAHTVYAETGVRPAMAHLRLYGRGADDVIENVAGGHADERETSVMLALAPALVDMSKASAAPGSDRAPGGPMRLMRPVRLANGRPPAAGEASADGATGDPTRATAAKGERVLDSIVEELVHDIQAAFPPTSEEGASS